MSEACLDHIVILVPDLQDGIQAFSSLGFNVVPGGAHQSTENALIVFEDKTYLELLALKKTWSRWLIRFAAKSGILKAAARRKTDIRWRLLAWMTQEYGSIDWCLRVRDVDQTLKNWRSGDLESLGSQKFSRERPDGQIARWVLGSLKDTDLPFLLSDISELDSRVPLTEVRHPNGATGIQKLSISTSNIRKAKDRFDRCFHPDPSSVEGSKIYSIGSKRAELVDQNHHIGKIALELSGSNNDAFVLDQTRTFGTQISISPKAS